VLIGRAVEWGTVEDALKSARESEGRVILLRGEAGVGKTALLDQVASESGFRTLRATGVEAESDLPYATAHQLLYPLLPLLDELPEAQSSAVRVALGMATGGTPDRFLVALGFLSLVSEAARQGPLALLLDDVQWWDTASLDAMLFLSRRLGAEPVLLLLAMREQPGAHDDSLVSLAGMPGSRELRLVGLAEADVGALVSSLSGVVTPQPVSEALVERTHGNPLALVELARVLTPGQVAGLEPLPEAVPMGDRLERVFLERARSLSAGARDLMLVAAAEPGGDLDVLAAATDADAVGAALEEIEGASLVRYDGRRLVFNHPLARSAVYGDASARARASAHGRLADALEARGDEDRAVWHRAAATLGTDDAVAGALDRVAERAQQKSGYASAAAAYERAADLSGDAAGRLRRMIQAADAAWLAGQPARSRLLVDRADPLATDPLSRGRLLYLQARAASRRGEVEDAHRLFLAGAELLRDLEPAESLELLAEAVEVAAYTGDLARLTEIGEFARTLPLGQTDRERFLMAWVAVSNAGVRSQVADDAEQLRQALALGEAFHDPRLMVWCGLAAMNLGDLQGMQSYYARALELARAAGAAGSMPYVLELASFSLALAGKYVSAKSASEEGLRLARETEQQRSVGQLLAILAFVAATKGDEAETRRLADEAREISVPRGIGLTNATASWALARLDLGLGRYDQAVDRLVRLASAEPGAGHPIITLWCTADLVEAAARARRTADVAEHVAWAVGVTGARGAGAATIAAWYQGLVGAPDAADQLLTAAEGLGELGFPLARARALLALGELLRRERRPRAAREHLRAAQETFHAVGATVWAERAAAELRASGDTGQPLEGSGLEKLTAQELQIVRYVSQGASNRDIAAQLFISPRTVEYHLYKAYPKLGISSRTQLISQLSGALAAAGPG